MGIADGEFIFNMFSLKAKLTSQYNEMDSC